MMVRVRCATGLVLIHTARTYKHDVAETPEELFWAVQSSITLNEIVKGDKA